MDDHSLEPRFSVIVPVFNGERHIGEALQSVIDQTYPAFEVIVVDDGSADCTAQIVGDFSKRFPISYLRQDNQGPAAARNRGVRAAKGDWIAFLDADDLWSEKKLEVHRNLIRTHPTVVFFWTKMEYINEQGHPIQPSKERLPLANLIARQPFFPFPSTVVIRRNIFNETGGFNARLRCYEDVELSARVATSFPISFIPQDLAKYRCHHDQLHRSVPSRIESWPTLFSSLWDLWHNDSKRQAALTEVSAMVNTSIGKHFLRLGDYPQARHYFHQSFSQKRFGWTNLRRWALSYLPGLRTIYRRAKKHAIRG